jgi:hypothetical protein
VPENSAALPCQNKTGFHEQARWLSADSPDSDGYLPSRVRLQLARNGHPSSPSADCVKGARPLRVVGCGGGARWAKSRLRRVFAMLASSVNLHPSLKLRLLPLTPSISRTETRPARSFWGHSPLHRSPHAVKRGRRASMAENRSCQPIRPSIPHHKREIHSDRLRIRRLS